MPRRRRTRARSSRFRWPVRLIILSLLAAAGYFGPGEWSDIPLPGKPPRPTVSNPQRSQPGSELALVERVVDGDTLVIQGGDRVRLIGVDTPETHHPSKPAQPYGSEAFAFTRGLVEGKQVRLQFDSGESKDRYGRLLAYVYVGEQFLNEALILEGYGRAMTNYPFSSEMKTRFRAAEARAKAARRGVWSLEKSPFDVGSRDAVRKSALGLTIF